MAGEIKLFPTEEDYSYALEKAGADKKRRYARFTLSALSSIPWVGGFLSAVATAGAEEDQAGINELQRQWLEEHRRKMDELSLALGQIIFRLEELGELVHERLEDPNYLALVQQGFRVWDEATTEEKRSLVRTLLTNAAGTKLCSDDLVRLFLEWIDHYHEAHFAVIREIHKEPGSTRAEIWDAIYGRQVREDSAEADLFKLLIRDLSTGSVIRQHRETTHDGQFVKRQTRRRVASPVLKSAFDNQEPYELTELGSQFVHYAMQVPVSRLGSAPDSEDKNPDA